MDRYDLGIWVLEIVSILLIFGIFKVYSWLVDFESAVLLGMAFIIVDLIIIKSNR